MTSNSEKVLFSVRLPRYARDDKSYKYNVTPTHLLRLTFLFIFTSEINLS